MCLDFWVFKGCFNLIAILMMSAKLDSHGLLKIFWKKFYDLIISVHDITNKISPQDSNYTIDMVMWQKFGNSNISMREDSKIWIFKDLTWKIFFEGWSWFKFNNLQLVLGIALIFCSSAIKGSKLQIRKFWGLIPVFGEVSEENMWGWGPFSWIG